MRKILGMGLCLVAMIVFVACSSDSGSKDDTNGQPEVAADNGGGDVTGEDVPAKDVPAVDVPEGEVAAEDVPPVDVPPVDVPVGKVTFSATLIGFGTNQPVGGVTVEILDNETGEGTEVTAVTDDAGFVEFKDIDAGLVGFKATKEGNKDTYQYNYEADSKDETLWVVPNTVYTMALGLAGLTVEDGKSTVAGAVYWVDDKGIEQPVGCAEITTDPATEDVRYMSGDTGLPTTLDKQPHTNPANGYFLATNLEPGQPTVMASVDGTKIGETKIFSVADSICISNIYATTDKHPSAECAE